MARIPTKKHYLLFYLSKTLQKEFNHHSWNSENILSFIFSKSSGKRETGSGQDRRNSTSLISTLQEVDRRRYLGLSS